MLTSQRALVRMPEVVGLPLRKARLLVENAGLVVDDVRFAESYEARDTVLQQKPARGHMVHAGESVLLTVSRESYVKWLPSIYQRADINGRNFFRDFLWVLQHIFSTIEEQLDVMHQVFDPFEAPEKFLPWLASWSAMVLEEDWPLAKKRRLIRRAIELYRIRGTVKGIKLFISLFTGHEPEIRENEWPFRGWRIGVTSDIGIDTVVLPPVNLAHTAIVEMPVAYKDLSPESVIRIHEILLMEKPANVQYYLRFAAEGPKNELNEFMAIGGGLPDGIGLADDADAVITSEAELQKALEDQRRREERAQQAESLPADAKRRTQALEIDDGFSPPPPRAPLPKAPKADTAPVEGQGPRSNKFGGHDGSAGAMPAVSMTQMMDAAVEPPKSESKTEAKDTKRPEATVSDDRKTRIGTPVSDSDGKKKDPEKK